MPEFGEGGRLSDKNLSTMWMIVDEPFWVVTEVTEEDIIVDKTDLNSPNTSPIKRRPILFKTFKIPTPNK